MRIKTSPVWNEPRKDLTYGCPYLGCVLFRSDDTTGKVLVALTADPTLQKGESFWKRLEFNTQEIEQLRMQMLGGHPCCLVSPLGVGILSDVFDVSLGMFVYFHLYEDPRILRRLLRRGMLVMDENTIMMLNGARSRGDMTEEDQRVLQEIHGALALLKQIPRLQDAQSDQHRLPLSALVRYVQTIAPLLNCRVEFESGYSPDDVNQDEHILCHHPHMMEGTLLHWLSLASTLSADKKVYFLVKSEADAEGERVTFTMKSMVDLSDTDQSADRTQGLWEEMYHMYYRSELCGINIRCEADGMPMASEDIFLPSPFRYRKAMTRYGSFLPKKKCIMSFDMTFSRNLSKDPLPCFKNKPKFSYDSGEEEPENVSEPQQMKR